MCGWWTIQGRFLWRCDGSMKKWFVTYRVYIAGVVLVSLVWYCFCLPADLFRDPYSTVLKSRSGELLGASIADDGQWRFPQPDSIPHRFATAITAFEDKRFWSHPGVDVLAIARAVRDNLRAGEIVSGGSTLSMQVIRLSRKGTARTLLEKMIETILATRLELRYSKKEILALYAAHAPFGGNVVGLEAACWRYFGVDVQHLSWGEAALLAVLPNAPSLIHPGKNRDQLKVKRDRLLDNLLATGAIDSLTCTLAKEEAIPESPRPVPMMAPHLLDRMKRDGMAQTQLISTLQYDAQQRVSEILQDHYERLSANQVFNAAAVVIEVKTGHVIAYVGNVRTAQEHDPAVDIVRAPRSTGSILKPFLYAAALDEGKLLPSSILPDVPTLIDGFAPQNFSRQYDGAVAADKALIRSLNIPAVYMLREYRYEKFHRLLKDLGMTTLQRPADHYGLSLILGGAEGTLWDITGMYASMARTLNNYFEHPGTNRYRREDFHAPMYVFRGKDNGNEKVAVGQREQSSWISASSIYVTLDALKELYRPGEETGWRHFSSSQRIAWKTGTSFGFRDAWAVGVTPAYAVGVWVGNADGEGRAGLTGTEAAAPVMFDIFSMLPSGPWFRRPMGEMVEAAVCRKSGARASEWCSPVDTIYIPKGGLVTTACSYHKRVHLTKDHRFRLHSECARLDDMAQISWFVLPPVQEYYYKFRDLSYKRLPPFRADCQPTTAHVAMDLIYPRAHSKIFIPRELTGEVGSSLFELAHRNPGTEVYWHLDGVFLGSTRNVHQLAVAPEEGKHILTVVDEYGETLERIFEVVSGMYEEKLR